MDIPELKRRARAALENENYPARRLALIHGGIALGVSLLLSIVSYLLTRYGPSTGGLSGMGAQAALSTLQTVLQAAFSLAQPFWQAGFLFAALSYGRGWRVEPKSLLQGFRRFKPLLSSGLLRLLQYFGVGFVSIYLSSIIYMLMPFASPMYEAAMKLMEDPTLDVVALLGDSLIPVLLGYLAVFFAVFAVLGLPVVYRYRMVDYIIMDHPELGGLRAMLLSRMMMLRHRIQLFKVDLSFWWFYVLEILLLGVSFGDVILRLVGVSLPVSDGVIFWTFRVLAAAGQLGLYCWAKPMMEVTYARCYEELKTPAEPKPQPEKPHPWND